MVLDVQGGKALLLSRYRLEIREYHTERTTAITWEKCTLRSWLNNDFLNTAFNMKEKSAILTTTVDNSYSQGYSGWNTSGGNNTQDRIFLLSYAEANRYLGEISHPEVNGNITTRSAFGLCYKYRGTELSPYRGWLMWLRSPGQYQDNAAFVFGNGSLGSGSVDELGGGICPALWLDLNADIF